MNFAQIKNQLAQAANSASSAVQDAGAAFSDGAARVGQGAVTAGQKLQHGAADLAEKLSPAARLLGMTAAGGAGGALLGGYSQGTGGQRPGETEEQYRTRILRGAVLGSVVGGATVPALDFGIRTLALANPVSDPELARELTGDSQSLDWPGTRRSLAGAGAGAAVATGIEATAGAGHIRKIREQQLAIQEALLRANRVSNPSGLSGTAANLYQDASKILSTTSRTPIAPVLSHLSEPGRWKTDPRRYLGRLNPSGFADVAAHLRRLGPDGRKTLLPTFLRGGRGWGSVGRLAGLMGVGAIAGDTLLSNQWADPDSGFGRTYADLFSSSAHQAGTTVKLK